MEVLNIIELSEYLHCSTSSIRKLIKNKEIPYFRIGNKLYFNKDLINKWVYGQPTNTLLHEVVNNA